MQKRRIVSLTRASHDEAVKRIGDVLDPYIDNMHPINEASIISILRDIRYRLCCEFDGFGFEDIEVK